MANKKLKACKACGHQISKTATKCPNCGEKNVNSGNAIITVIVFFGLLWFFFSYNGIEKSVAKDSIKEYNLTVKGGNKIEICVHAGLVAAAFNQAHDEKNYLKWKKIEERDCKRAGISK